MVRLDAVPRRCVNLPPRAFRTLVRCLVGNQLQTGPALDLFHQRFGQWLGAPHVFGAASGRSAFHLALEALALEPGAEIIFPKVTFPVIPMVAKQLGYQPVFCEVDPETFNAGPEHIAPKITPRTGAVVATHLFGQACAIEPIVSLARQCGIRVVEDCAHVCGVRVGDRQLGMFGDVGVFSFAEGKNMPCFGGGAIATADDAVAERATAILSKASLPAKGAILKTAVSVWGKWLLTRPSIFGLTVYPALRLKLRLGHPLMDSAVGDELLDEYHHAAPQIRPISNLQAAIGLLHMEGDEKSVDRFEVEIDVFNMGAQQNAQLLTKVLSDAAGIKTPGATEGHHIYVYYPLTVNPMKRNDLRHYLLRHGIDTKTTDMSDCSTLAAFCERASVIPRGDGGGHGAVEASILEFCVYPDISRQNIWRIAFTIRDWSQAVATG